MKGNESFLVESAKFCPYRSFSSCLVWESDLYHGTNEQKAHAALEYREEHKCRDCLIGYEMMQRQRHVEDALGKSHIIPKDKHNQNWTRKVLILKPESVCRISGGDRFSIQEQLVLTVGGSGCYRLDNGAPIECIPVMYLDGRMERSTVYRSEVLGLAGPEAIRYFLRSFVFHNVDNKYYKALDWMRILLIKYGGDVACLSFGELMREHCELPDAFYWYHSDESNKITE